jgi:pimeloyl-ACP methyl ester carboxylesterase
MVFWQKILRAVLLLAGLGVGGMLAWAFAQQASATRQTATAATVAATGSAAGNVLAALVSVVVLIGAPVGYVMLRRHLLHGSAPRDSRPETLDATQSLAMLVQVEVLRTLREMRAPQAAYVFEGGEADDDDDDLGWW